MNATFTLFGIPMQQQRTRRRLVITTYFVLALICAISIAGATRFPLLYCYAVYPAMAVAMLIFGGAGQRGLLKGFENKPPRTEQPLLEIERLRLLPKLIIHQDNSIWKNDERELSRRDRAHYKAYQIVGSVPLLTLLLSAFALFPKHPISATTLLVTIFALSEIASVLSLTLPAAIILWTEPDIDTEPAFAELQEAK